MATLSSIHAKIAKLQAQAEALVHKQSSATLERIRGLMEKHGITIADIEAHIEHASSGRKRAGSTSVQQHGGAPKYQDPKTGATWTGHGRAPAWIASVKDRSKFLIGDESADARPAVKRAAKANARSAKTLAPKYLDPKTGATWSGRGRAPAWLATAKDRTKFAIADEVKGALKPQAALAKLHRTADATNSQQAPEKKLAAKKFGAKKAAAKKVSPAARKSPVKNRNTRKVVRKAPPRAPKNGISEAGNPVSSQPNVETPAQVADAN